MARDKVLLTGLEHICEILSHCIDNNKSPSKVIMEDMYKVIDDVRIELDTLYDDIEKLVDELEDIQDTQRFTLDRY